MTRKLLITGVSGFIGNAVALQAEHEGWDVVGISRRRVASTYEVRRSDWSTAGLVELIDDVAPDVVLHTAARYEWSDEDVLVDALIDSNFGIALRLWHACRGRVGRFVGVGSYFESMRRSSGEHVNLYSGLKDAFASLAASSYGGGEVPIFIEPHLTDVYGPGDTRSKLIPALVSSALRRQPIGIADLDAVIRPLHVIDAVAALLFCAAEGLPAGRFALPIPEVTIRHVVHIVERIAGDALHIEQSPARSRLHSAVDFPILPEWKPGIDLERGIAELMEASE